MSKKLTATLILTFFLGFPAVGLIYFFMDANKRIERSAEPFARKVSGDILSTWDGQLLDDVGTLNLRKSGDVAELVACQPKLGAFKSLTDWKTIKAIAGEREGDVWQFAAFSSTVEFEKGKASLRIKVGRRTMNPEWRVEEFKLEPR